MSDQALTITLPASSYEEAYPLLRRPYMPSQVWAKVQTVPKKPNLPCTIALFSIGETLMDRLNLVCGRQWGHEFTKTAEAKDKKGEQARWYCEVSASLTVFGKTESDIGKGVAPTRAGAEMNARAQAYKRAGRKFGPGQCLYACEEIIMFRGSGEHDLRLPKGEDGHLHPYFDEHGHGRRYVRSRYQAWLNDLGKGIYGEPLDHLDLATILQAQSQALAVAIPNGIPHTNGNAGHGAHTPQPLEQAASNTAPSEEPSSSAAPAEQHSRPAGPAPGAAGPGGDGPTVQHEPMPDHPAPLGVIQAAAGCGYSEAAARGLCNLARADGQGEQFLRGQCNIVENWLTVLHGLEVPEDVLIGAASFNAARRTSQERRQALFSQWLARRAAGATPADPGSTESAGAEEPVPQPDPAEKAQTDLATAIAELQGRMADHVYGDLPVTRLAALAVGAGPQAQVTWAKIKPETLRVISDLLDCAAALGWDSQRLDREVLDAHASTRQQSAAGRFSAFANQLKDMAETRQIESE